MKKVLLFVLLSGMSINHTTLKAQITTDSLTDYRPKIGLVLSGGGAKGFAHIGVLKVLEESGIKPDYISGTSMGSIVAGLYALGYSAEELEQLVTEANWNDLLTDKITLRDIPIQEKEDYPGYPLQMSFKKGAKLSLPSGMIEGQKIQALFSKLSWSSHAYDDFDAFPIPYRCVATDIISGKGVVFSEGNLAEAMRSSMSIPTVFTPIEKGNSLYIDGGLTINYPVQQCIDMGADFIIGVYTGFEENPKKEELQSMIKILARASALNGIIDAKTQIQKTNIFIVPNLTDYGAESFNKASQIIAIGELAARDSSVLASLKKIPGLKYRRDSLPIKPDTSSIYINNIAVEGANRIDSLTIIKISQLEKETRMNASDIDAAVKRIYAAYLFDKVTYRIEQNSSKHMLVFKVDEGYTGYLRLGLHYDNDYGPNALIRIAYNDFLLRSTKAVADLSIGSNPRMILSYRYYPTKRRSLTLSLNTYLQIEKMPDIITEEQNSFSLGYYTYLLADFNAGLAWSPFRNTLLQINGGRQFKKLTLKEGMDVYYSKDQVNYNISYLDMNLHINTLDDPYFPTKGVFLNINMRSTFDATIKETDSLAFLGNLSKTNDMLTFDFKYYFLIGKRFSIIPSLTCGFMANEAFLTEKYFLGGNHYSLRPNNFNCAGIRSNYLATDNFFTIGMNFQYSMSNTLFISFGGQQTVFFDYSDIVSANEDEFEDFTFGAWSAGIGYYSKIGPLRLILSKSQERDEYVWNLNLGVPF